MQLQLQLYILRSRQKVEDYLKYCYFATNQVENYNWCSNQKFTLDFEVIWQSGTKICYHHTPPIANILSTRNLPYFIVRGHPSVQHILCWYQRLSGHHQYTLSKATHNTKQILGPLRSSLRSEVLSGIVRTKINFEWSRLGCFLLSNFGSTLRALSHQDQWPAGIFSHDPLKRSLHFSRANVSFVRHVIHCLWSSFLFQPNDYKLPFGHLPLF